jgi:ubiquinone/menaquinone biosynthesis C-methylase UbiE
VDNKEIKKAVKELTRVTKTNGHVIVSVDNKYPTISRIISERSFDKIPEFLESGIFRGGSTGALVGEFDFKHLHQKN